jgi:hypothetical protein
VALDGVPDAQQPAFNLQGTQGPLHGVLWGRGLWAARVELWRMAPHAAVRPATPPRLHASVGIAAANGPYAWIDLQRRHGVRRRPGADAFGAGLRAPLRSLLLLAVDTSRPEWVRRCGMRLPASRTENAAVFLSGRGRSVCKRTEGPHGAAPPVPTPHMSAAATLDCRLLAARAARAAAPPLPRATTALSASPPRSRRRADTAATTTFRLAWK